VARHCDAASLGHRCVKKMGDIPKKKIQIIDVLFPLVGLFIEGFEQTPLTTGK